ncbi:hypothetical protein BGX26_012457 [Mortierella sp. AD094]|nr:hypothetical protein BGX26_012457 [Mortierella sp. AD094]
MASSRHHHDQLIHDSEETSDSNEEFASASEGDDDLPWEPVVIRSPVISKQSPHLQTQQELAATPRPAPATLVPGHGQDIHQYSHEKQEHFQIHAQSQQQQQLQQQQFHQQASHSHHTSTFSGEYTSTSSPNSTRTTTITSQSYSQSQLHTRPQISQQQQQQQQHFISSSSTSTRSQFGSNQTLARSVTPKLRERMRQSPVLQSKVVQAYLDPNASSSQRQLMTPEYVRQTWLQDHQDNQQESSEDDGDIEDEQDESLDQKVPISAPSQVRSQLHTPAAPPAPSTSFGALSHQDQNHEEASWGFDDTIDIEETQHGDRIEASLGFDDNIETEETLQSSQTESSLQYQNTVNVQESVQLDQVEASWGFEDNIIVDDTVQQDQGEAWGFEENIVVDDTVQQDQGEASWGFEDNISINETVQIDQKEVSYGLEEKVVFDNTAPSAQMRKSWELDDQLKIDESAAETLQHLQQSLVSAQVEEYPHIHHVHEDDEDAWGYDDQLVDLVESAVQDVSTSPEAANADDASPVNNTEDSNVDIELEESQIDPPNPFLSPEDDIVAEKTVVAHHDYMETESTSRAINLSGSSSTRHQMEQEQHSSTIAITSDLTTTESFASSETSHDGPLLRQLEDPRESHNGEGLDEQETSKTSASGIVMESEDVEASWGFDMDEVVDVGTHLARDEEHPLEQDNTMETQQHDLGTAHEPTTISEASRDAPGLLIVHSSATFEQVIEKDAGEQDQFNAESDNEHDSEVREVLRSAQSNLLIGSENVHQTTINSVTMTSVVSDLGHSPRSAAPPAQTLSLQIKNDELPEFIEASGLETPLERPVLISVAEDVKGLGSDSEGSDIYRDLSTARAALIGSSNRLNEILDDDDFLEHMERGVPMNRSISTPISDDEQPKFTVDDDLVELMERGEPRPVDGVAADVLETLDEGDNVTPVLERNVETSSTITSSESSLQGDVLSAMEVIETVALASSESLPQDSGARNQEIDNDASLSFVPDATAAEPEQESSDDAVNIISDDQDPANPFSDAAAIDDQDAWPSEKSSSNVDTVQERIESLEASIQLTDETHERVVSEETAVLDSNVREAVEAELEDTKENEEEKEKEEEKEDAWANQDADITIESFLSNTTERVETTVITGMSHIDQLEEQTEIQLAPEVATSDQGPPRFHAPIEIGMAVDGSLHSIVDSSKVDDAWAEHDSEIIQDLRSELVVEEHTQVHSSTVTVSAETEVQYSSSSPSYDSNTSAYHVLEATGLEPKTDTELGTIIDEALEEDAWADQGDNIVFNSGPTPAIDESEKTIETTESIQEGSYEGSRISMASEVVVGQVLDDSIDAALEDDAWADQDVDIVATLASVDIQIAEPAVDTNDDTHVHAVNDVHDLPPSETNLDYDHAFDTAIPSDAWDNQNASIKTELHEISSESRFVTIEDKHESNVQAKVNEVVADAEGKSELESGIDIDHTQGSIEDDAWGDKDAWSDHEVDTVSSTNVTTNILSTIHTAMVDTHHQVHEVIETHEREQAVAGVEVEDAINNALEADMWGDQDIEINVASADIGLNDLPNLSKAAPSIEALHVSQDFQEDQDAQEPSSQAVYMHNQGQPMATSPITNTLLAASEKISEAEFNIDEALEADVWDTQDDSVEQVNASAVTTVETIAERFADTTKHEELLEIQSDRKETDSFEVGDVMSSDSYRVESIHSQPQSDLTKATIEDAWGWDDDEVGIDLDSHKEETPSQYSESLDTSEILTQHAQAQKHEVNLLKATTISEQVATPPVPSPASVLANSGTPERFPPLNIQEGLVSSGGNSGEGDEDSSSQSPWQDVSPTSASKRSEAGVGSEVESEYSIRSLDEYERVSPAPDHARNRSSGSGSVTSESRKGLTGTMSWTDLKHDEWQMETSETTTTVFTSGGQSRDPTPTALSSFTQNASVATIISTIETKDLPDISGADSWDFDEDDNDSDLDSVTSPTQTSHVSASRDMKTPDICERRSFGIQSKTSSTLTPSPGRRLSSSQSGVPGSISLSPSSQTRAQHSASSLSSSSLESSTTSATVTTTAEVEDDSHLPLAIRQQRARLAAKGKPLPPISKYKKTTSATKEIPADQTSTATAISPSVGAASPVISFVSPANPPISPMLSPTASTSATPTSPDQKYLSPALLKQRERLEKKRAAAASGAATPLSAVRRLTLIESSSEQTVTKVTSPQISQTTFSSTLKHTVIPSPTLTKKTAIESKEQTISPSLSSPTVEEFGQATRRRGLSASHNSSTVSTTSGIPTSPLVEGAFTRRSKDGSRPKMSLSASTENQESDTIAKTSQSDTYRYTSRVSTSSSRSGWDGFGADDDGEREQAVETPGLGSSKRFSLQKESPKPSTATGFLSTSSSSSFYQQTVPGLDDEEGGGRFEESKTSISTSTFGSGSALGLTSASSSSYLSSKKVDDYDPYGPMASKASNSKSKARGSMEESEFRADNHDEIMIGQSATSPGVSLLSPTSATSISNRHDHLHRQHHNTINNTSSNFSGGNTNNTTSNSGGGGFFGGGGNSLVGDISSILSEKKMPPSGSAGSASGMNSYDNDNKKASISSSASSSSASNLQKSSSWSFGSWVSSAVAVASEAVDKAYETLDPEYSKMKNGGGSTISSDGGLEDVGSMSPYKKPGYVVGGSSLALGLASISVPSQQPQQPQQQQQHQQRQSPPASPLGFGTSGANSLSFTDRDQQQHQGISPRLTRKNVSERR